MDQLLLAYENGAVGLFIRESIWGYPIVLASHAVGMATVLGVAWMLCLRVLGFAKGISITSLDKLFIVGWAGFLLNLISGIVLFAGSASVYFYQWTFQLKLGAIILGGILLKFVMNEVRANGSKQKLLAALCAFCWLVGVVIGRLLAYVTA